MRTGTAVILLLVGGICRGQNPKVTQTVGSEIRSWTGGLVDAARTGCGPEVRAAVPGEGCAVNVCTTDFGLVLPEGKFVKFDVGGNAKARDAVKRGRKARSAVFAYWKTGKATARIVARVKGSLTSDTLNVESIEVD
jgi:hypothetical protein